METPSRNDSSEVLVDISDIIVSEESVSASQGRQLWMRPEQDVGH
ncbi:hypothetical protein OHA25_07085 [Nonomuraea sp. NBC_00507]